MACLISSTCLSAAISPFSTTYDDSGCHQTRRQIYQDDPYPSSLSSSRVDLKLAFLHFHSFSRDSTDHRMILVERETCSMANNVSQIDVLAYGGWQRKNCRQYLPSSAAIRPPMPCCSLELTLESSPAWRQRSWFGPCPTRSPWGRRKYCLPEVPTFPLSAISISMPQTLGYLQWTGQCDSGTMRTRWFDL